MILIEVIKILGITIIEFVKAILETIWTCLPDMLKLKQIAGYFTPAGMVALYLGVPTFAISLLFFIVRKTIKSN